VNLGIPVAGYVTAVLPRAVGEHRARDWLLTGREVSASEAIVAFGTDDTLRTGAFPASVSKDFQTLL
jgi:hypothetical protein